MTELRDLRDEELRRELSLRRLPCPSCGSQPGHRCDYGKNVRGQQMKCAASHLGRYSAAVWAGLVPPLEGVDHGCGPSQEPVAVPVTVERRPARRRPGVVERTELVRDLTANGWSAKAIGRYLGVTSRTVTRYRTRPS